MKQGCLSAEQLRGRFWKTLRAHTLKKPPWNHTEALLDWRDKADSVYVSQLRTVLYQSPVCDKWKKGLYSLRKWFSMLFCALILLFYLKYWSLMRLTYVTFAALAPSNNLKKFLVFFQPTNFKEITGKQLMAHGAELLCREGKSCLLFPMKTTIQSHLSKDHLGLVSLLLQKHRCWGWKLIYWLCLSPSGMELNQCPKGCSL